MFADLVQLDVPRWIQYVALAAGFLAALRIIAGVLPIHWTSSRVKEQVNDYIDERVDDKLAPIIERQTQIAFDVSHILEQLSPNHGESVHDDVKVIRATVTRLMDHEESGGE